MVSNPDKLARAVSKVEAATVSEAVQVRRGFGLSLSGIVASVVALVLLNSLIVQLNGPQIPWLGVWAAAFVVLWGLKKRGVVVEAFVGRSNGTIVMYDASPFKRRPVRQVRKRYAEGIVPLYHPRRSWWRLPTLEIDGDAWFVAQPYVSVAERWYAAS